jgi:hypothetical protein
LCDDVVLEQRVSVAGRIVRAEGHSLILVHEGVLTTDSRAR